MTIEFHNNSADSGGVIIWTTNSIITIGGSNFTKNRSPQEAVILHSLYGGLLDRRAVSQFAEVY